MHTPSPHHDLIRDAADLRDLYARHLYIGVQMAPEACAVIHALMILVVDRLIEADGIERDRDCLEAVARDLDLIARPASAPAAPRPRGLCLVLPFAGKARTDGGAA